MKEIYAVVKVNKKTIKSQWFVKADEELKDVTLEVFSSVYSYNNKYLTQNVCHIPYVYKDGFIIYAYGCGLTHYLNDRNVKEVLEDMDISNIRVFTNKEFKELMVA